MTHGDEPTNPVKYNERSQLDGLTKREYFAAQAMKSLIEKGSYKATEDAVTYADKLIEELNKE